MANTDVDQAVAQLACRQQGLFSRPQALARGASPSLVQRRLASGRWLTVDRGVYAMPGVRLSWERRQAAACMGRGLPLSCLTGRPPPCTASPAAVRGRQRSPFPGPPRRTTGTVGCTGLWISPPDVSVVRGIRVAKRLRTLLDLAAVVSGSKLAAVLDDLIAAEDVALEEEVLTAVGVYARRGKKASTALRHVLAERGPGYVPPESELERKLTAAAGTTNRRAPRQTAHATTRRRHWLAHTALRLGRPAQAPRLGMPGRAVLPLHRALWLRR